MCISQWLHWYNFCHNYSAEDDECSKLGHWLTSFGNSSIDAAGFGAISDPAISVLSASFALSEDAVPGLSSLSNLFLRLLFRPDTTEGATFLFILTGLMGTGYGLLREILDLFPPPSYRYIRKHTYICTHAHRTIKPGIWYIPPSVSCVCVCVCAHVHQWQTIHPEPWKKTTPHSWPLQHSCYFFLMVLVTVKGTNTVYTLCVSYMYAHTQWLSNGNQNGQPTSTDVYLYQCN